MHWINSNCTKCNKPIRIKEDSYGLCRTCWDGSEEQRLALINGATSREKHDKVQCTWPGCNRMVKRSNNVSQMCRSHSKQRAIGTKRPNADGYMLVKVGKDNHPRADSHGWVFEHILVAEKKYGFPITIGMTVHHINGNKSDNKPENLEVWNGNHGHGHKATELELAYKWAIEHGYKGIK